MKLQNRRRINPKNRFLWVNSRTQDQSLKSYTVANTECTFVNVVVSGSSIHDQRDILIYVVMNIRVCCIFSFKNYQYFFFKNTFYGKWNTPIHSSNTLKDTIFLPSGIWFKTFLEISTVRLLDLSFKFFFLELNFYEL